MPLVCPHCSRTNSGDARYCYFDGASLLGSAGPPEAARKTFIAPFVFPTGEACNTFDEFAYGCQRHWNVAVDLLHAGLRPELLRRPGTPRPCPRRTEAAAFPDRERGLDQFLSRLPTSGLALPKLDVQPKLINLGNLEGRPTSQFELSLDNLGSRLVFGSVSSNCNGWRRRNRASRSCFSSVTAH